MTELYNSALPYEEPDIVTILIQSSFLLALNLVNHILDNLIYCGLLGQVFLGIAWGTPGAKWLGVETEKVIVNIGYLGLILLVYEGGLSTNFKSLKANLALSAGVALTGISLPIGLSYVLLQLCDATPLQAFAAGAALCSTSLGTTFTVLGTSGLVTTRMGVVLSSAAMMDDVVGLVMVQVISELGGVASSFSAVTVIRPVFVSVAFAVVVPVLAHFIVKPLTLVISRWRFKQAGMRTETSIISRGFVLVIHTSILLGMVAGSSYAGTSNLFAAYLAGASISWWDSEVPHFSGASLANSRLTPGRGNSDTTDRNTASGTEAVGVDTSTEASKPITTGEAIFKQYYEAPLQRILKPFFFASIGFSIPITKMFTGSIVWKGLVYALLMLIGKMFCGLWLVRLPAFDITGVLSRKWKVQTQKSTTVHLRKRKPVADPLTHQTKVDSATPPDELDHEDWDMIQNAKNALNSTTKANGVGSPDLVNEPPDPSTTVPSSDSKKAADSPPTHTLPANTPLSLYPGLIVGTAMVARGEIGFLISSVAQSNGILSPTSSSTATSSEASPLFLIVTWAIMLCTILGPVFVGLLVKRVRKLELEAKKTGNGREKDVLGAWGVS